MIPELGNFALVIALCLSLAQALLSLVGAARNHPALMAVARPAAAGQLVFVGMAFMCLAYGFIHNDFTVQYVADHSNSELPLAYRIAGVWGGHEGSLLLWYLIFCLWMNAVASFSGSLPRIYLARVLGVMALIGVGFLSFLLLTSNPFLRQFAAPLDGADLNPLLQDPAMVAHPPMLYMGYVGFSVAFSLAVAALLGGRLDATWARWSRPWTVAAWMFLTIGIALGSWWAYYELGWGGWWFWDPVENASFMPWLAGTALIHSLAVSEKRGLFKAWTVLLAIAAFSLSLLGTFLVRSGVLTSVHAFANDPGRGLFILGFLGAVVGSSLLLYAWRAPSIRSIGSFELNSRETLLLINNVLLLAACAAVLLGTLYPLAMDALGIGKISVGPPYFNTVFAPLMLPLALLIGLGPLTSWKRSDGRRLWERLRGVVALALFIALVVLVLWIGISHWLLGLTVFLALWIAGCVGVAIWSRLRLHGGWRSGWTALPRGFYGMHLAHLGVAVFMLGVGVTSTFDVQRDVRLAPGESVQIAGYDFRFEGLRQVEGPNYNATEADIRVFRDDREVALMHPQKRVYRVRRQAMSQVAIDPGFTRDILVALGEPLDASAWSVRIHYKPMVRWIWLGAAIMALGGLLALSDRRYRRSVRESAADAVAAGSA